MVINTITFIFGKIKLIQQGLKAAFNTFNFFPTAWPYVKNYLGETYVAKKLEDGYKYTKECYKNFKEQHPVIFDYFHILKSDASSKIFTILGTAITVLYVCPVSAPIAAAAISSSALSIAIGVYGDVNRHLIINDLEKENRSLRKALRELPKFSRMSEERSPQPISFSEKFKDAKCLNSIKCALKVSFWENIVPIAISLTTGQLFAPAQVFGYTLYAGWVTAGLSFISAFSGIGSSIYRRINSDHTEVELRKQNSHYKLLALEHKQPTPKKSEHNSTKFVQSFSTVVGLSYESWRSSTVSPRNSRGASGLGLL
jgi:hypothetical protein